MKKQDVQGTALIRSLPSHRRPERRLSCKGVGERARVLCPGGLSQRAKILHLHRPKRYRRARLAPRIARLVRRMDEPGDPQDSRRGYRKYMLEARRRR